MRFIGIIFAIIFLTACMDSDQVVYAPVSDISTIEPIPQNGMHRVLPDESIYSIAWRYGLDYRYLAKRNHLKPPYHLTSGEMIYLRDQSAMTVSPQKIATPKTQPSKTKREVFAPAEREPTATVKNWRWPARGQIIGTFSNMNKGINIAGKLNQPIYATAAGKIVYSGEGLRRYGKLIIIKHNSTFLSAYAHNNTIFVKEGDWVNAGQTIAEMGKTGTQTVMLHFEIRRNGKPVNPLMYLAK